MDAGQGMFLDLVSIPDSTVGAAKGLLTGFAAPMAGRNAMKQLNEHAKKEKEKEK
jgi:hypothetical protein